MQEVVRGGEVFPLFRYLWLGGLGHLCSAGKSGGVDSKASLVPIRVVWCIRPLHLSRRAGLVALCRAE